MVVQTAPAIRAALGECFGYPPGTLVTGKMVAALRRLGFDAVFDTNFTADLTIMEEGTELLDAARRRPWWTSSRWPLPHVHQLLAGLDQVHGALLPGHAAEPLDLQVARSRCSARWPRPTTPRRSGKKPEDIFVVSIMPCTAKKFEAQRPEMNASGVRDVDVVLTTRELGRMIKQAGIDFAAPAGRARWTAPLGMSSGAADIFANTGGVMEAALRTVYEIVTGRPLPFENLHVDADRRPGGRQGGVASTIDGHAARVVVPRRRDA